METMSWIVQNLLTSRELIKNRIHDYQPTAIIDEDGPQIVISIDFDNDEYVRLLSVERKITELKNKGLFTPQELMVIDAVRYGESYHSLEGKLDISRITISKTFESACNKIAYGLGGEFTDEGYIEYFAEKHDLTYSEMKTLKEYIQTRGNRKPKELLYD